MSERDPLGGGPSEAIAVIQQAVRQKPYEFPPSAGVRGPGPTDVNPIEGSNQPNGQLVNWRFLPSLLKTGYLNPDPSSNLGLRSGLQYRQFMGQRLIGWSNQFGGQDNDWVRSPADGYSGRLPAPIGGASGLPVETRPAAQAR